MLGLAVRSKFTYLLVTAVDVNAPVTSLCNAPRIQSPSRPQWRDYRAFNGLAILAKVVELS